MTRPAFLPAPSSLSRPTHTRTTRLPARPSTAARHRILATSAQPPPQTTRPRTALSQYDQLAKLTTIVEDTGEINSIALHRPFAATTNPSLVTKAASMPEYAPLVDAALAYARGTPSSTTRLAAARAKLFTLFGAEILKHVPGDVSTEVDARLSFDAAAQVAMGRELVAMYDEVGVGKDRVLIKLAATWEGVQACRVLEAEGIRTNVTLLFNRVQAAAAADAGAFLISPFVGRILDWHKKAHGVDAYAPGEDPGVLSVKAIYNYYKCLGYKTIIMGASFRNKGEILQLAGCDRLTIAPKFIADLKETYEEVEHVLTEPGAAACGVERMEVDEKAFRWAMNEDAMATEKLAEGIRGFAKDLEALDKKLAGMLV